jgi:hypothetical protein
MVSQPWFARKENVHANIGTLYYKRQGMFNEYAPKLCDSVYACGPRASRMANCCVDAFKRPSVVAMVAATARTHSQQDIKADCKLIFTFCAQENYE